MRIRVKSKYQHVTSHDANIIKKIYDFTKELKFKQASDLLQTISLDAIIEDFNDAVEIPTDKTLKLYKKIIIICKEFYSNDMTLISDSIYDPMLVKYKIYRDEPIIENLKLSRRSVNTGHKYPELKGTLDKANVFYKTDKKVKLDKPLEDFIDKLFEVNTDQYLELVVTKKFDGGSIVGEIEDDRISTALTRGEDDKGADLTHLFKHVRFKNHKGKSGVQFECVITKDNFEKYCNEKGKQYASLRSGVVSILTRTKDTKFCKYLTLVPIKATDIDITKDLDYKKLNKYYATDIINEPIHIKCNSKLQCMNLISDIIYICKMDREELNYAIDGIVIDCINANVRNKLGRKNDINQYQIAYKFEAEEAWTKVIGITTTTGRTGLVTPMVYYKEIMFNGGVHDHSSISSFNRFMKLDLHYDDTIRVTYNNDVMPYVSKPDIPENNNVKRLKIPFPTTCSACNTILENEGANFYCRNPQCPSKLVSTYVHFYKKLGINNISEKTVEKMIECGAIKGLETLLNIDYKILLNTEGFGEVKLLDYKTQIDKLIKTEIDEAKITAALSICGETIARSILIYIDLNTILNDPNKLLNIKIPGAGDKTKESFLENLENVKPILIKYMEKLNISPVKNDQYKLKVYFSGFRDKDLKELLKPLGVKVSDNFNKSIDYLITNDTSGGKIDKAKDWNIPIMSKQEFGKFIREEFS